MNKTVKKIILSLLIVIFLLLGVTFYGMNRKGLIVLMYHKVDYPKKEAKIKGLYITPKKIEKEISILKKLGYKFIDYKALLEKRDNIYDGKHILLTLDDGYENNYKNLFPILKKEKIPAHIFMICSAIGKKNFSLGKYVRETVKEDMLTENEIKEMENSGLVFIGSHLVHHRPMISFDNKSLFYELSKSKEILSKITGKNIDLIAYPSGSFDKRTVSLVKKCGYKIGFTTVEGRNFKNDDKLMLKRYGVAGWNSITDILIKIWFK